MTALLVCQAGEGIGLGHLSRSLVVASTLRDRLGTDVHLLIQGEPVDRLELMRFTHRFVASTTALGPVILDEVNRGRRCVVFLDLHPQRVPRDLSRVLESLHEAGCRIVGVDGLLRYRDGLDLVFLPSLRCDDPLAEGPGAPVVYGLDCFLIAEIRRSNAWAPGRDVLVLTGGADATGLGSIWPKMLDERLPARSRIQWVQGPYAQKPRLPSSPRLEWIVHEAPSGLQSQIASVNYAITIFGVSFFELLKMGVPTVVFSPYGSKDALDLQYIAESGVAVVATDERDAAQRMALLMEDDERAGALSLSAERMMASSGGERLCGLLASWLPPVEEKSGVNLIRLEN